MLCSWIPLWFYVGKQNRNVIIPWMNWDCQDLNCQTLSRDPWCPCCSALRIWKLTLCIMLKLGVQHALAAGAIEENSSWQVGFRSWSFLCSLNKKNLNFILLMRERKWRNWSSLEIVGLYFVYVVSWCIDLDNIGKLWLL